MVLTFFTLIWRFVKRYAIVCVACSLVVYGLSFIGCGISFLVKYHFNMRRVLFIDNCVSLLRDGLCNFGLLDLA